MIEEKDKILTIKDWIESFWTLQEEDLRFFREELKEKLKDPKGLLDELKERMENRKIYYQLFKHVSWKDLPREEWTWVTNKLDEIVARENLITESVNKILDVISELLYGTGEQPDTSALKLDIPEKNIIFH